MCRDYLSNSTSPKEVLSTLESVMESQSSPFDPYHQQDVHEVMLNIIESNTVL